MGPKSSDPSPFLPFLGAMVSGVLAGDVYAVRRNQWDIKRFSAKLVSLFVCAMRRVQFIGVDWEREKEKADQRIEKSRKSRSYNQKRRQERDELMAFLREAIASESMQNHDECAKFLESASEDLKDKMSNCKAVTRRAKLIVMSDYVMLWKRDRWVVSLLRSWKMKEDNRKLKKILKHYTKLREESLQAYTELKMVRRPMADMTPNQPIRLPPRYPERS